ncbi:ABC transporter permease [Candidatus Obscuribacterales bacterium]|jgi:phospholipid/cholesterol/gamma-HCH transport system permease protein|nr:ABC transporter permease [Candidatus Obscuribacterales bacterium]
MTSALKNNRKTWFNPWLFFEEQMTAGIELLGQVVTMWITAMKYIIRRDFDAKETWRQCYMIGVRSFVVVAITALFTGFAMSLQISRELVLFGADTAIGGVVSLALVREIGPITAGVMVAGRVGSSVAAELATMVITEQIDALKVMRVDPVKFLVVPRYIAGLTMTLVLSVYAMAIGLLAGIYIANIAANLPAATFLDSVKQTLLDRDFVTHFIKSEINATIIIMFSCAIGLHTRGGAEDVGIATTRTVVWTMTLIFVFNYIVTSLTYAPR